MDSEAVGHGSEARWRSGSEAVGHGSEAVASGSSPIISFPRTRLTCVSQM